MLCIPFWFLSLARAKSTVEENHDILAARQAAFEQEMLEDYNAIEQSTSCVRYGLMELVGFVRHASFTSDQVRQMMTQERGNLIWNVRNRTENTDPIEETANDFEQAEEESPTSDAEADENGGQSGLEKLLQHMRKDQNIALAAERWYVANEIQQAIVLVLDATAGPEPEGMGMRITNGIRNVFQRLHTPPRNRGQDERRDRFRLYVENMERLMRWIQKNLHWRCNDREKFWKTRFKDDYNFGLQNKPCSVCKGGVRKVVRRSHVPAYTQGWQHKSRWVLRLSFSHILVMNSMIKWIRWDLFWHKTERRLRPCLRSMGWVWMTGIPGWRVSAGASVGIILRSTFFGSHVPAFGPGLLVDSFCACRLPDVCFKSNASWFGWKAGRYV